MPTKTTDPAGGETRSGRHAALVGAGILLSRIAGLVRQRVFSHYFGLRNDSADAFTAAVRIPNVLQNLFGEGALSASFIPVYAGLISRGERDEADRTAGAVASLLALVVSVFVLVGVLATPILIAVIAPGFTGTKRELTIELVEVPSTYGPFGAKGAGETPCVAVPAAIAGVNLGTERGDRRGCRSGVP